ncbi:hypothetical protein ACI8AF_11580 [Blastococcus sp. SYSU D00669]
MTIRWLTDADRAELARIRRECLERGELYSVYGEWLHERAGHPEEPIRMPPLSLEAEARLLELLRALHRTDPL